MFPNGNTYTKKMTYAGGLLGMVEVEGVADGRIVGTVLGPRPKELLFSAWNSHSSSLDKK